MKMQIKKYKKIILDIVLNITATAIPLIILQLVVLPLIATKMSDELYGFTLTIISTITIIASSLGNALNNVRLIKNIVYEEKGIQGDFSILLLGELVIGCITLVLSINQYKLEYIDVCLLIILTFIWIAREYLIVTFRLELNFKGIVINNIIMVVGYVVGLVLYSFTLYWQYVYILGISFSLIYIIKHSDIITEKIRITPLFKATFSELLFLIFASLINNLLNYADRIIIYPLIGGTAVSIYYASTLFGKIVSTAISPLNSVALSYLAKKNTLKKELFIKTLGFSVIVAIMGYIICPIIALPVLNILYPDWAYQSIKYVPITTCIAMVTMVTSVMSPFVLKFCSMKWQLVINVTVLIIYLSMSIALYKYWGLMGFCIGILISNIAKFTIMFILGLRGSKECQEI
mgnify:CR=1 FL=1